MVSASDVVSLRLAPQGSVPDAAHGSYRARPGEHVAVLTTSALPRLEGRDRYVGWVRRGDAWVGFGPLDVGEDGRSLSVAEHDALVAPPDEVSVTRESRLFAAPSGVPVLAWSAAPK
jgi:hypothetical protein